MTPNPLTQSDAYANMLRALGTDVRVDRNGETGRCLIQTRRFPVIGSMNLISRGPVGLPPAETLDYLRALEVRGPLILNSDRDDIGGNGMLRLAAPKSVALLPLSDPETMRASLHQNWRNALKRAERAQLKITHAPYHPAGHTWLIDAERAQQKSHLYHNWPRRLLETFAKENPGRVRVVTAGVVR